MIPSPMKRNRQPTSWALYLGREGLSSIYSIGIEMRTEKIPRSLSKELPFVKDIIILKDELEVSRIGNHNAWRKCWDRYLVGLEAEVALAFGKPSEELVTRLEEAKTIAE